jgi:tRNA threonylcarbamoyl adenosine modification protein (Sua5/YciO/YrdC/YwlC family)
MSARIVRAGFDDEGLEHIREAARLIASGGLVAFPTETVYGIGCNAEDSAAVERLRAVKARPEEKPFTLHIAEREAVARLVEKVPAAAEKLMRRYWPGPLTIVCPSADGSGVGLRMPSNRIALELLRRCRAPVYAPSANLSGQEPAKTAQEVAKSLGHNLDLILDGGPTSLKEASTVVRVSEEGWEVLRHGSIAPDMIQRTLGRTIVFVCTANSCRSPMAEYQCKEMLAERLGCSIEELPDRGYSVLSAGTAAMWDLPASTNAREAMRRRGLDMSRHKSRPITPGLIEDADAIYVMARHHQDSILSVMPEAGPKVRMLDPTGRDVSDPVGGSVDVFVRCGQNIRQLLEEVVEAQ